MMSESKPNVIVVLGSESGVIKPVVELFAETFKVVRIFNQTIPKPLKNCIDIAGLTELDHCLEKLEINPNDQRIGFIGAAFARQNLLFVNESSESLNEMIKTNVSLYIESLSILLPRMIRSKFGRLVYLSSFRASDPVRGTTVYSASKAFGETLFSGIGKEYGRFNISALAIRMGYFENGMMGDYPTEKQKTLRPTISFNRFGNDKDLMSAIDFAFDNPYLSSGVIDLNGGLNLG